MNPFLEFFLLWLAFFLYGGTLIYIWEKFGGRYKP